MGQVLRALGFVTLVFGLLLVMWAGIAWVLASLWTAILVPLGLPALAVWPHTLLVVLVAVVLGSVRLRVWRE